jgi:acyl-[acyl-carrier-protein] desaturase
VDDTALLERLQPTVRRLLDRHVSASREWFPHELVPRVSVVDRTHEQLATGVRSALVVNVLTEDALPFYMTGLHAQFGGGGAWWDWIRRWTAEEWRHGAAIHEYLDATRLIDPVELERQRFASIASGVVPGEDSAGEAIVYLALQELATRIAHANTARRLPDESGRRLLGTIAADEALHHLFYRDLVSAALELDPATMVVAIDHQVRHFTMPGYHLPGFAEHAAAIADAGIYSARIFLEHIARPLAMSHWHVQRLDDLPPASAAARDRLVTFLDRMARIADRLSAPTSAGPGDGATPLGRS